MNKAKEIAAERYAKGEITLSEFEDIKKALLDLDEANSNASTSEIIEVIESEPIERQDATKGQSFYQTKKPAVLLNILLIVSTTISFGQALLILLQRNIWNKLSLTDLMNNELILLLVADGPYLISFIIFLFWKKKSTDNLFAYRGKQTITPAGAVYWYFVPIAWFWKPYEAMRNLVDGFNVAPKDRIKLPIWWAAFWGSGVVVLVAFVVMPEIIETEADAKIYVGWYIAMYLANGLSAFATKAVFSVVSKAQLMVIDNT